MLFVGVQRVAWGARTLDGGDGRHSEWKYVNVRRLLLFIEASIDEGRPWAVFEPNDEPLWQKIVGQVLQYLMDRWRVGALQGSTPKEAFFVLCDRTTMT